MYEIIDLNRHLLEIRLEHLQSVQDLAEEAFSRHDARIDEWYEERRIAADDDEIVEDRDYLKEVFDEQKAEANDIYPQIARASLFAMAYGIFEDFMVSLCKHSERHLHGPGLRDLRGEGIVRARLYLTKVARVDCPNTQEWKDLTDYGLLRNALLHAQGDISNSDKAQSIEGLAKRTGTFVIKANRTKITLSRPFNGTFMKTVENFSRQLEAVWREFSSQTT